VETVKVQLEDFLSKCEEVRNCKFIMATSKIKDLLRSIANSAELYELFNTVVSSFDYNAAKQRCFVQEGGVYGAYRVILPDTVGERLAFIFCLLVEFDNDTIHFNDFLQTYYQKDGSFYASYHAFCDDIILKLEGMVEDVYHKELNSPDPQPAPARESYATIDGAAAAHILLNAEVEALNASSVPAEDKDAGLAILAAITRALNAADFEAVKALTCGYNYFVLYTGFISGSLADLFAQLGALLQ